MQKFKSVEELVNQLKPEKPVYCIRKNSIQSATKFFKDNFPGKILYAVKTNPHPVVIKQIIESGVDQFDVASIQEIKAIRKFSQTAKCSYMHTVKSRESIKEAYFKYGIKTFSLDTKDELIKIIESTNNAKDLELFVRVAVSNEHAEIDLSKKFGALSSEAAGLLRLVKQYSKKIGLSFHVGSQCMHPISYAKGITEIGNNIRSGMNDNKSLLGDYITKEELWACTSCNACTDSCPIDLDPLSIIIDMRRYLVMEQSAAPSEINTMFTNIENNGAPWQFSAADRLNWKNE